VATNAKFHIQVFRPHSHGLLSHIPMALLAIDSRANVWRMLESNMFRGIKPVHRLPGDVLFFVCVSGKFFDLRIVDGNRLMTRHAERDARDSGVWPLSYPGVATRTLQPLLKMNPMIKRNGLHWSGLPLKVLSDGIDEGFATWFEDWGEICWHGGNGCANGGRDS
jgi:hypothetical protein